MPKPLEGVQGSGMHTHMSLFEGDENAFYEAGDPLQAVEDRSRASSPGCSCTRREITADHQPDGELLQAADPRLRGAGVRRAGPGTTAPRSCGCPITKTGKAASTRIEYRAPDPAAQPLPRVLGDAGGRPEGHRGGLRAADARRSSNVFELTDEERAAEGIDPAAAVAVRGARRDGEAPSSSPRRWASTSSSGSCATSAGVDRTTRPR